MAIIERVSVDDYRVTGERFLLAIYPHVDEIHYNYQVWTVDDEPVRVAVAADLGRAQELAEHYADFGELPQN